jgi:transcriptional regulator with XRE-family HTH domain
MATFAERLCEALLARNMSAAELSRALGINEGTVSQYKKGLYEPKQKRTQEIARILNVSIAWLMGAVSTKQQKTPLFKRGLSFYVRFLCATSSLQEPYQGLLFLSGSSLRSSCSRSCF